MSERPTPHRRIPRHNRPQLELLEGRELLAAFSITNTNDSGAGSLRQAIIDSNKATGSSANTISFSIPGGVVQTIALKSALPAITQAVYLDARSPYTAAPLLALDGSQAGAEAVGLDLKASGSTLAGLIVDSFNGGGVLIDGGSGDAISGDYIGESATGAAALGNGGFGVKLQGGAHGNTIGGASGASRNIISANQGAGVVITGAGTSGNTVYNDYIGVDWTGKLALGNTGDGVDIQAGASSNTIGGATIGINVISGNGQNGIAVAGAGTTGNSIQGSYIGTDATGTAVVANHSIGVLIQSGATANIIGGTTLPDVISGFGSAGVVITGAGTARNVVGGDYVGTNAAGTAALRIAGVLGGGVSINSGATANTIGGTTTAARDIISGNLNFGIAIADSGTSGNVVEGDYIGTNVAGTAAVANGNANSGGSGVEINNGATGNTIGGLTSGARNLISGNAADGVSLADGVTSGNVVEGDYIGTDPSGAAPLGNALAGVYVFGGAGGNTIGGTAAGAGDVISGNGTSGVYIISGSGSTVAGDWIGTDVTGRLRLPNALDGVRLGAQATGNAIGGTTTAARDVISANGEDGVQIDYAGASGNVVEGDYIGTDATGGSALGNGRDGVYLYSGATGNTIGAAVAGGGDVISGNAQFGVIIDGSPRNTVAGDFIGIDGPGTVRLSNGSDGVHIVNASAGNTIGGTTVAARDVISGNTQNGVLIDSAGATGNVVEGDYIGADATGLAALGNGSNGVLVQNGATGNTIGGTTSAARDVLSGNGVCGAYLLGQGTSGNVVAGDYIGTDSSGNAALPNHINGVDIVSGASANTIGGTTSGARDVISGNTFNGAVIANSGASSNIVEGDYIGPGASGSALSNGGTGVVILGGATNNTIGGTAAGAADVISGNAEHGVLVSDAGTAGNVVAGDLIGTGAGGTMPLGNGSDGVLVTAGASANTIGGTVSAARDVISANGYVGQLSSLTFAAGVAISGSGTTGNVVAGDYIGTGSSGTAALGNALYGVLVNSGAAMNTVGGLVTGARDVLSGNGASGIEISSGATGNVVEGDYIGTDASGTRPLGNVSEGVSVFSASSNTIGGTAAAARDVISANGYDGVFMINGGMGNVVEGDYIGTDASGTLPLGNVVGVAFSGVAGDVVGNAFGQTNSGAGNVIAFNSLNGFQSDGNPQSSTILGNSIFGNGNLGIAEAAGTGATLEPAPMLQTPMASNGTTTIRGTTTASPVKNGALVIQIFASPTGSQGKTLVDQFSVTTDANGNAAYSVSVTSALVAGQMITATATDQVNGTSVFSGAVKAPSATPVGVDIHGQPSDTLVGRAIAPVVKVVVVDAVGHQFRRAQPWVRISVLSGPAGARLLGRTRVRAVAGVATFRGLRLTEPGRYTLTATSPGLTADISKTFTVVRRR
jgi:hypothetical protein